MTDLVSLLFIAMIPIDCKITNFSLHIDYRWLNAGVWIEVEPMRWVDNILDWV